MLKVDKLHGKDFMRYVSLGPSVVNHKSGSSLISMDRVWNWWTVKNDTFRTLATDHQFKGKVKEDMLIRLLDAFIWKNHGTSRLSGFQTSVTCVDLADDQDLNVKDYHSHMCRVSPPQWAKIKQTLIDRNERLISPFPIHNAIPIRSFRLFLKFHRKYMSTLRSTDFSGCTSWTESESITPVWKIELMLVTW